MISGTLPLKEKFKPLHLKEEYITYDIEAEKKDPDLAFKRIVKNVVATLNQKDTRLDYN